MKPTAPVQFDEPARSIDVEPSRSSELLLSFLSILLLSGIYIAYELLAEPRGSHPFGHILGILGTVMMLMTEILYSVRKRTRLLNRAGPVRYWLSFHIFTGLVGPFLVLMHTGLMFRGLAGLTMLLTLLVVASGFIGRYLYTALPRALSGADLSRREITIESQRLRAQLAQFQEDKPAHIQRLIEQLSQRSETRNPMLTLLGRSFYQWRFQRRLKRGMKQLDQLELEQRQLLGNMLDRRRELEIQIEILETARRALRYWHILHVPIGLTLFFSVAVHIVATFYFRAGLLQ